MSAMASQITSLMMVYSTVYSSTDQSKHYSFASLAFVWGIHRWTVNSPHKGPVTRKMFPFDDVIMTHCHSRVNLMAAASYSTNVRPASVIVISADGLVSIWLPPIIRLAIVMMASWQGTFTHYIPFARGIHRSGHRWILLTQTAGYELISVFHMLGCTGCWRNCITTYQAADASFEVMTMSWGSTTLYL